jgi:GT2 family glycosyltransferase
MINQKDVTIIIPYWGKNPEERYAFKECMASLLETCECPIIVVANGGLGLPEITLPDRVKLVEVPEQGQCRACNIGVAMSDTPWVMISNDDMIYSLGWFKNLTGGKLDIGLSLEGTVCISPKLVEPRSGAPTFGVYFCGGAGGDFDKKSWLEYSKLYENSIDLFKGIRKGFNLPFLMPKELWETIGGYDEVFDPFGSNGDSDLEYKIKLAGIQSYQNTNAIVYHFSQTSGTFHPDNRAYWDKNWHYFIEKWGFERASSPEIWTATFEIPMDKLKYRPDWIGKYGGIQ